jgi:hypothetical protein
MQSFEHPNAETLGPFDTTDSCGEVWAQKACIRGFIGETPHRGRSDIDCGGREVFLFEKEPVAKDDSSVEMRDAVRSHTTR